MPHSSASGRPIAWKNSSTSTGVGAAPTLIGDDLVEAEHRAQPGEELRVGLRDARGEVVGHRLARLLEAHLLDAPRRAPPAARSRCSSGWPASIVSRPALSFSQMRGTAKNQLGRTSGR